MATACVKSKNGHILTLMHVKNGYSMCKEWTLTGVCKEWPDHIFNLMYVKNGYNTRKEWPYFNLLYVKKTQKQNKKTTHTPGNLCKETVTSGKSGK